MIIPAKLKAGDEIRVIAPSRSATILSVEGIQQAKKRFEGLGFIVTFGKNIFHSDLHNSAPIDERIADLHEAFQDRNVKGILTVIGGFNCNELLPYIDYECIRQNPKIFCGYSDITAIAIAITAKTGLITYSGPHFSSFQMEQAQPYQTDFFKKCLMQAEIYQIHPSAQWSDDAWFWIKIIESLKRRIGKYIAKGELVHNYLEGISVLLTCCKELNICQASEERYYLLRMTK